MPALRLCVNVAALPVGQDRLTLELSRVLRRRGFHADLLPSVARIVRKRNLLAKGNGAD